MHKGLNISAAFKRRAIKIGVMVSLGTALSAAFHGAAYDHMAQVNRPYNEPLPQHVAVVTGGAHRVALGLEKLAAGEISGLHISGVSSPKDSILLYNNYDLDQVDFRQKISLDRAKNTQENAVYIVQWAAENGIDNVGIITSSWHMDRLMRLIEQEAEGAEITFARRTVGDDKKPSARTVYWEYGARTWDKTKDALSRVNDLNTDFQTWFWGLD